MTLTGHDGMLVSPAQIFSAAARFQGKLKQRIYRDEPARLVEPTGAWLRGRSLPIIGKVWALDDARQDYTVALYVPAHDAVIDPQRFKQPVSFKEWQKSLPQGRRFEVFPASWLQAPRFQHLGRSDRPGHRSDVGVGAPVAYQELVINAPRAKAAAPPATWAQVRRILTRRRTPGLTHKPISGAMVMVMAAAHAKRQRHPAKARIHAAMSAP